MNRKFVLKIKKTTQAEFLLWTIIVLPFFFATLTELLGLPGVVKYVCDIALLGLLLLIYLQRWRPTEEQKGLSVYILCYLFYTLIGYAINFQSPLYYLWGLRNNFRMYAFFIALMVFGTRDRCSRFLQFFDAVFWINAAVCFIQYFILGKDQDFLGGIFGVLRGGNAWLNNYFVIMSIKSILACLNKRETLLNCAAKCGTMLLTAALAELKFFYIEFVVILAMALILTDFSWKKILILVGGLTGVVLTTWLLEKLFPIFEGAFSLKTMYQMAVSDSGYTNKGDINRLNAIGVISERFLELWPEQLVGMGLGNADTAGFAFLTTPFYSKYSQLNYIWFSSAMIFLETGYIGLVFFFAFFILVFFRARKLAKKRPQSVLHCQMAMICAVCCAMIGIYNSSLRMEAGYMLYFVLAIPFMEGEPGQIRLSRRNSKKKMR